MEKSTNYAFALEQKQAESSLSFHAIREASVQFFQLLPDEVRTCLYNETQRGICPLDSEPRLNAYMFSYGKMHNAKLRTAYDHLSLGFQRHETIDIVDYGCGQAMGCICYADFLRENGIRQRVRRVVLIEPSELALARAALHVSLLFPDAEIRTVCKGFDDLLPEELCCDADVPMLHILSNVLDLGDKHYDLDKFADLIANTIKGNNEFVCVEPLFGNADDTKLPHFIDRVKMVPYFQFQRGKGEFVVGKNWTCAICCGQKISEYDYVGDFIEGFAKVKRNDVWTFIDINRKELTLIKYSYVFDFKENMARVRWNEKWGFLDKTGREAIPIKYTEASNFYNGLAIVELNEKRGCIDTKGRVVIPIIYDLLRFSENMIIAAEDYKYSCMDFLGHRITFCHYDEIRDFNNGFATIELNRKYGVINNHGVEIIPPIYDRPIKFNSDIARVEINGKFGYINTKGDVVIPIKYDWDWDGDCSHQGICDSRIKVRSNNKWGFFDLSGKEIIPIKYDHAEIFRDGIAIVKLNNKCGCIDKFGNEIIPIKYDSIGPFCEGFAHVTLNGNSGFIDKAGIEIVPIKYDVWYYLKFSETFAKIRLGGKWGYVDRFGENVLLPHYEELGDFHESLAKVRLNNKWGAIDKSGRCIIPIKYDDIHDFRNGLAEVKLNGKWGYINKFGRIVIPIEYDYIWWSEFNTGTELAKVELRGKLGCIDKTGKEILSIKYDAIYKIEFCQWGMCFEVEINNEIYYVDKYGNQITSKKNKSNDKELKMWKEKIVKLLTQ